MLCQSDGRCTHRHVIIDIFRAPVSARSDILGHPLLMTYLMSWHVLRILGNQRGGSDVLEIIAAFSAGWACVPSVNTMSVIHETQCPKLLSPPSKVSIPSPYYSILL